MSSISPVRLNATPASHRPVARRFAALRVQPSCLPHTLIRLLIPIRKHRAETACTVFSDSALVGVTFLCFWRGQGCRTLAANKFQVSLLMKEILVTKHQWQVQIICIPAYLVKNHLGCHARYFPLLCRDLYQVIVTF